MTKFILEEFAMELKLMKVVAIGSGRHGDRSTRLFGGHKGFYHGQCPLTVCYFNL